MMPGRARTARRCRPSVVRVAIWAWLTLAITAAPALGMPGHARSTDAHASIVGGSPASAGEFPWLAYIEAEEPTETFACSGTVVAPRIILTAGHCVQDPETGVVTPSADYLVATGALDLSTLQPSNVSTVSQAVLYPGFDPSRIQGDAAILVLSKPTSAPSVAIAPPGGGSPPAGTRLLVAGWGLTDPSSQEAPAALQWGSTVLQRSTYCGSRVGKYYPFFSPASQICAVSSPAHPVATCHGDSGGPALAGSAGSLVEVGITSLGADCDPSLPDVFTRVDQISSWVERWIAAVEGSAPTPTVKAPTKPTLPLLTVSKTRQFVAVGLGEGFRSRYRRGSGKRVSCERVEREKVKCGVSWYQGGDDYYGTITIYYLVHRDLVYWNDRYRIHWVSDQCCFHSGHRQTCAIHTRHR